MEGGGSSGSGADPRPDTDAQMVKAANASPEANLQR